MRTARTALLLGVIIGFQSAATFAYTFGKESLDDVYYAAQNFNQCSPYLTTDQLAKLMLTPTWWEVVAGQSSSYPPSPMTLSRGDDGPTFYAPGGTQYRRAFWHTGIGVWQLDDKYGTNEGANFSIEKFNTQDAAIQVAKTMSDAYCKHRQSSPLYFVFAPYCACASDGQCSYTLPVPNTDNCEYTYNNLVGGQTVDPYLSVDRYGGGKLRTCSLAGQATSFPCIYVNAALAQGPSQTTWWTGNANGTPPLALPFYVYKQFDPATGKSYEWRYWMAEDTLFGKDFAARRQYGQGSSDSNYMFWVPDARATSFALCDVTASRGACQASTISILATLDGSPWPSAASGVLSWELTGPTPRSGGGVPTSVGSQQPGVYTLSYKSGGPPGATLVNISPASSQTLAAGGSLSFTFNFGTGGVCTATNSSGKASCTPPTVTLNANPLSVTAGNSSTLSWSSSHATSCVASGGWSGTQATSGSKSVTPSGTTTYTLTCSGTGGSTSKSVTVTVTGSGSAPAVYLSSYPDTVTAGTPVGLGWATSNAASCTASGGWSGSRPLSGGETVYPSTTTMYTLTCSGTAGGSASASVTVTVTSSTPSINIGVTPPAIDPGGAATLQWSTTGVTSCSASGGWSGSKSLSGSQQVSPSSTTTYTLTCTGSAPAPQQLARNGGFSGTVTEWTLSSNFYANSTFGSCNLTCPGYAYLSEPNGSLSLSNNLYGTMRQDISLPASASSISLSFWVSISTQETGSTPADVLSVSLLDSQGNPLTLIQAFSNVNAGGYRETTFDLTPYKGQTVRLQFVGTTDAQRGTVFRVDDVSIVATFPGQQVSKSATLTVKTPSPPGLTITATPDVVNPGQSSTLAWTSSGTTSCTASNGWSGSRSTSGNEVVTPSATTTYTLSCSGPGGTATGSATVVVKSSSPPPTGEFLLFASRQACSGIQPAVLLGWTMPQGADRLVTIRRSDGQYIATVNTAVTGPVFAVDSGLLVGGVYHFRAEANLNGSTIVSNDLTVPITSDECRLPVLANDLPHRPVLWAETPYCENGVAKVRLFWTEAAGTASYSLDRTAIYMDSVRYDNIGSQTRSFVDSNLTPGAGASYGLNAVNSAGSISAWRVGVVVPGTVCDTAGAPGSFAARSENAVCSAGTGAVTVRWDPSTGAASDYRIFEFSDHQLYRVYDSQRDFVEQLTSLQPDTVSRAVVQAQSSAAANEFREAYPVAQLVPVNICGTSSAPPAVGTASASYIRADQALLKVSVTANGSDTTAYFEWGTSTAYGLKTSTKLIGNRYSSIILGEVLAGLSCGTTYHFRVVATNVNGTVPGTDGTFTTPACAPRLPVPADFDGDGVSEWFIYRGGAWLYFGPGAIGSHSVWTGATSADCIPAPADYDGDGKVDLSLKCGGAWHFFNPDGSYRKGIWTGGVAGDLPVPADYDGDGRADVVVYRGGAWLFFDYATGAYTGGVWTGPGYGTVPLPMDYDGDGRADFTVYQNGAWHFYNRDGTYFKGIWTGGVAGDIPVPGDYHGVGREEVVIFRGGAWLFFSLDTAAYTGGVWTGAAPYGGQPLQPAPLDLDGDGTLEFTVYAGGPWHFYNDDGTYLRGVWTGGVPGDRPISRRQLSQ